MTGSEISQAILNSIRETDLITWIATISAVIYVILALRENIWCWSFGIISSGLSVGVYFNEELYFEAILNIFYVVLGIYGWVMWSRRKNKEDVPVISIDAKTLSALSVIGLVVYYVLSYLSDRITNADYGQADAAITVASVIATWMTAKKYLENWILWIVIDAASAILYFVKGPQMYLFALLFIFYTFIAIAGYRAWKRNLKA